MFLNSKICLFLLLLILISCTNQSDPLTELFWLNGEWQQINAQKDKISLESWSFQQNEIVGNGYTIRREPPYDTLFKERLKIISDQNEVYYIATIPGQQAIRFKLTSSNKSSWSFTNSQHDYPKIITYIKTGNGFTAEVGDLKRTNQLKFEPIKR